MTVATNIIAPIDHTPASAATAEIPAAPAVNLCAFDEGAPVAGAPLKDLLPAAVGGPEPAANDAIGPEAQANARLRRVMAPRLVRARMLSGLSQGEVAKLLDYKNQTQLNLWEQGRRLVPMPELVRVADALNVPSDYLLGMSPEPERDAALGLRRAMLNGVRSQLDRCAQVVIDEVHRHAKLVGVDSGSTATFIAAGAELLDAVQNLIRLNRDTFDNMKGGASVALRLESFEEAIHEAKRRQRFAHALDADLRERLSRLPEGDVDLGVEV